MYDVDHYTGEDSWQPNLVLDDGGDATHVLVKKFPAVCKQVNLQAYFLDIFVVVGAREVVVIKLSFGEKFAEISGNLLSFEEFFGDFHLSFHSFGKYF